MTREQEESVPFRRPYKRRTRVDIEKSKNALESALVAETTPSLHEVARNLSCSSTALVKHFPALCKNLCKKYKNWRKGEWSKIEAALQEALTRDPPQPIKIIAKDLKRNHTSIYTYFLELCRQIAQRYALFKHTCREQEKENFRQEIRDVAIAIHQKGLYPSVKLVEARLSTHKTLRYSKMALDTLREVREELAIPMRPNNFARFALS